MDALTHAHSAYSGWRLHDAFEAAQSACEHHPRSADAWHLLARTARHVQLHAVSDDAFRRAHDLDPRLPVPHRLGRDEFRALLAGCGIGDPDVEALPVAEDGVEPDAMQRRDGTRWIVYQENLENESATPEQLRTAIAALLR